MCWNCEEICGKMKEVFLTLFLRNVWGFFQPQCEESMCWNSTGIFLTIVLTFGMWGKRTFTIVRKKVLKFPYIFPHILLLRIFLTIFLTFTFPHIFLTFFLTFGMWGKRTFTIIVRKKVLKFPYIFLTFYYSAFSSQFSLHLLFLTFPYIFTHIWHVRKTDIYNCKEKRVEISLYFSPHFTTPHFPHNFPYIYFNSHFPYIFPHIWHVRKTDIYNCKEKVLKFPYIFLTFYYSAFSSQFSLHLLFLTFSLHFSSHLACEENGHLQL